MSACHHQRSALNKIMLLTTGGTIASTAAEDGRSAAGALSGETLAAQISLPSGLSLGVRSVFQKPSNAVTLDDLCTLRAQCQALIDEGGLAGIAITHGTDTLEDTAWFLESTLDTRGLPVVITGSQRVPHAPGTDAFVNLRNAILVAAHPDARDLGVLVAFNESIFAAGTARKVSSFQVNGFGAPGLGCLGVIDNENLTLYQRPVRLPVLPAGSLRELPPVDIIATSLGARPALLEAAVQAGARGLVIDGLGRGHVPPEWMPAVRAAIAAGVVVLVCSSTLHGPLYQTYDFTGSLHELETAGAIGVSNLTARKARLRLAILLGTGVHQPQALRDAFETRT